MSFVKIKTWLAGLTLLALVACGGGGGGGDPVLGGGSGGGTTTTNATDLQIKFSPATVDNSGTQNVKATITAINANGQGVAGVPLTISVDKNATYSVTSDAGSVTGTDGTVTADVTIGNDYSVRTVTMTVTSGALPSRSATFEVTGSRQVASDLTLTASPSIPNSVTNSVTVTATAVDANRNALPNIPITLSVDSGATLVPSGTVTGVNGTLTGVVRIGQDQANRAIRVRATSGTVVRETVIQVTGSKLTASSFSSTVGVGTTNAITYLLVDNTGAKMAGYKIVVKATGLPDVVGVTDADGQFRYSYTAPATAQQIVVETTAGGVPQTESIDVTGVVVIPPASVAVTSPSISASPNVIAVNAPGATSLNKVEVRALFLGVNNAPVKNVRVWFDLDGDKQSIGGSLESKQAGILLYSDTNGVARTTFAPGSRFSPKDGVTVRACWSADDFAIPAEGAACANSVKTTLTVVSESLSVSIGTNGTIGVGASGLTYTKRYVVQVVDSSGQAKTGVQVAPSIDLLRYYKGQWILPADKWIRAGRGNTYPAGSPDISVPVPVDSSSADDVADNVTVCDNEDLNRNGVSETFQDFYTGLAIPEDQNGSGGLSPQRPMLDPRKADVTISVEGSSSTDANGIVVLKIEFPQNVASWVRFNILVAASGVAGTEGRANYEGILEVPATVVTNKDADPPFKLSPYGVQSSPTYLRRNPEGQMGWLCTNPN